MGSDDDVNGYGMVTNPQRYECVQVAARELIDRLLTDYAATIELLDKSANADLHAQRVVRMVPANPAAAPISFEFTDFPGVKVRCGHWFVEAFPRCGCDRCDEQPDALIADLCWLVDAVTNGTFIEDCDANERRYRIGAGGASRSGTASLSTPFQDASIPTHVEWAKWDYR